MTAPTKDESIPTVPPAVPVVPVVPAVQEPVEPRRKLWQALFFTKDGRLDIMQLLLGTCCIVGLTVFVMQAAGRIPTGRPDGEAWGWFAAFTSFCFGAGAVTNFAALKAKGGIINAVTQVVAERRGAAQPKAPTKLGMVTDPAEPNLFFDDESGD
jgi:hypothetical protein